MMKFKVLSCSIMLIASQVCDAQHYWKGMGIERNSKEVCLVSNGLKVPVSENSITVKPWSIVPDLAKEFEVIR